MDWRLCQQNHLYTCFCVNTTCLCSSSAPFSLWLRGTSRSCFTTCSFPAAASPRCDSRRSEGESGGEHALTTSHVDLKQEKHSPGMWQCTYSKMCLSIMKGLMFSVLGQQYDEAEAGLFFTARLLGAEHEPLGSTENTLSGNIGFLRRYGHPARVDQGQVSLCWKLCSNHRRSKENELVIMVLPEQQGVITCCNVTSHQVLLFLQEMRVFIYKTH